VITGRVTADREAVIPIQVQAAERGLQSFDAVIDTGFTEFLALPPDCIAALRLPLAGLQRMTLADGSVAVLAVHEAVVHWHDAPVAVQALEIDGGALLGMAMLQGSRLTVDALEGGPARIDAIVAP
jgi:clan AA aspartic protease